MDALGTLIKPEVLGTVIKPEVSVS
jgi:hypothetical protein